MSKNVLTSERLKTFLALAKHLFQIMEERIFIQSKNKPIVGSSEKVSKTIFLNKNNVIMKIHYCLNLSGVL